MNKIGLGGGCHWCTEAIFQSLKGVSNVQQGWIGSVEPYEVLSEAILLEFDRSEIDLFTLISIHLYTHSCTSKHALRKKYRSAIYTTNPIQNQDAIVILEQLQTEFDKPIITLVLPIEIFRENEEKFLNYYYKNPEKPFCQTYIQPKFQILMAQFAKNIDDQKIDT